MKYIIFCDNKVERIFESDSEENANKVFDDLIKEEDEDNLYTSIVLCKLEELKRKEYGE